jgi:hypothetical protein
MFEQAYKRSDCRKLLAEYISVAACLVLLALKVKHFLKLAQHRVKDLIRSWKEKK